MHKKYIKKAKNIPDFIINLSYLIKGTMQNQDFRLQSYFKSAFKRNVFNFVYG